MKAKDYELIKDGKFNRKAIMQRAWAYVRNYGYSLKSALNNAWCDAKVKMQQARLEEIPRSFNKIDLHAFFNNKQLNNERETLRRNVKSNIININI